MLFTFSQIFLRFRRMSAQLDPRLRWEPDVGPGFHVNRGPYFEHRKLEPEPRFEPITYRKQVHFTSPAITSTYPITPRYNTFSTPLILPPPFTWRTDPIKPPLLTPRPYQAPKPYQERVMPRVNPLRAFPVSQ